MAQIKFRALCSGTVERISQKTGKPYKITSFTEVPTLKSFEVFGDLGLTAHEEVRDYTFEANIVSLGDVKVLAPASASQPKK